MAQAGTLEREDHYWREGMEDWLPLPDLLGVEAWEPPVPPQPPLSPFAILGGFAAAVAVLAVVAFLFIRPESPPENHPPMRANTPGPDRPGAGLAANELRDKAAADLRQKIERLPAQATPPLNTFYYDVRVNMNKTLSAEAPWSATMVGGENVVDPATQSTIRRTSFTLKTDYENGVWVYKQYRATVSNLDRGTTLEIEDDESSAAPPSIVGMLGLKTRRN